MPTFPSRLPDCQPVAESRKNRDSASLVPMCEAALRISVRPVASDVSHAAVRRAAIVAVVLWPEADLDAAVPDLGVPHAFEPVAAVQEDQLRVVRRIADTPVGSPSEIP